MKIPKSFKVGDVEYEVIWKWNLRNDDGTALWGLCDRDKPRIFLDRSIVGEDRISLFRHESLHAVITELRSGRLLVDGKRRRLTKNDLSYAVEELIVKAIEEFDMATFKFRLKGKK